MRRNRDGNPTTADRVALFIWFASALVLVSALIMLGVIAAASIPGLGLRAGAPIWGVPLYLAGVIAVTVVFGGAVERLARHPFGRHRFWSTLAAEIASLGLLWLLLLPLMADGRSAFVAAVASILLFKAAEPLLAWMESRRVRWEARCQRAPCLQTRRLSRPRRSDRRSSA